MRGIDHRQRLKLVVADHSFRAVAAAQLFQGGPLRRCVKPFRKIGQLFLGAVGKLVRHRLKPHTEPFTDVNTAFVLLFRIRMGITAGKGVVTVVREKRRLAMTEFVEMFERQSTPFPPVRPHCGHIRDVISAHFNQRNPLIAQLPV